MTCFQGDDPADLKKIELKISHWLPFKFESIKNQNAMEEALYIIRGFNFSENFPCFSNWTCLSGLFNIILFYKVPLYSTNIFSIYT